MRLAAHGDQPVAVVLGDRHHGLAGDVAAKHYQVGLIERGRVEKLAPADLGSVNVGGEEDPHVPPPRPCCSVCPWSSSMLNRASREVAGHWRRRYGAAAAEPTSVADFLWNLVPAHPVAYVCAQLPLHALGYRVRNLGERGSLCERVVRRVRRSQLG